MRKTLARSGSTATPRGRENFVWRLSLYGAKPRVSEAQSPNLRYSFILRRS
jgi:hypothetical protein